MKDNTVKFKVMPKDFVTVLGFNIDAVVDCVSYNRNGTKRYGVEWVNKQREIEFRWFDEDQVAKMEVTS